MITVDDTYAARIVCSATQKDVAFDYVIVAVTQCQGAASLKEYVSAKDIAARLRRDDLDLASRAIEDIVGNQCVRVEHRVAAGSDPQRLATIGTQHRTWSEVIVFNPVPVLSALLAVEPHRKGDALVRFA